MCGEAVFERTGSLSPTFLSLTVFLERVIRCANQTQVLVTRSLRGQNHTRFLLRVRGLITVRCFAGKLVRVGFVIGSKLRDPRTLVGRVIPSMALELEFF